VQTWQPFIKWLATGPQDFAATGPIFVSTPARSYWDADIERKRGAMLADDRPSAAPNRAYWTGDGRQVGVFWHGYDSVWLPASLLEAPERQRLGGALFEASRHTSVELHFNKGLAGAPAGVIAAARDTATNPAVLSAFALAIVGAGGPPAYPGLPGPPQDLARAHRNAASVAAAGAALRTVVPQAGSYVSESDYFNATWRDAFWGANYPRLRAAKARYDPDGLFIVHHGVGSEDWSPDGFTRERS
jgi:FAD/FMN-containing dehydrogenase